jgi:hypothetical protein
MSELEPLDPTRPLDSLDGLSATRYRVRLLTQHVIQLREMVDAQAKLIDQMRRNLEAPQR